MDFDAIDERVFYTLAVFFGLDCLACYLDEVELESASANPSAEFRIYR